MDEQKVLERVKVREVTGVLPSTDSATAVMDDLLLAGFDRADIDTAEEGEALRKRLGGVPVPAVEVPDVPGAPRREVVAPEDTAAIFAVCVGVTGGFGALIGAFVVIGSGGTTLTSVISTLVGGILGCGLGLLIAWRPGWQWRRSSGGADGTILWVRVRTPEREQKAFSILSNHGAYAVRAHEIEIEKRLEDLPLSSIRPDPWLSDERLGEQ